jgi:hypothetical protein
LGVLRHFAEEEVVEVLGAAHVLPPQAVRLWNRRGDGQVDPPELRDVALGPMPPLLASHPEEANARARMPADERRLAEEEECSIRDRGRAWPGQDQAESAEQVLGAPATEDRGTEEATDEIQIQIQIIEGRLGADPLLVPDAPVGFLARIDDLLWLAHDAVAHAVGKTVGLDHHGLGRKGHLQDEDLAAVEGGALGAAPDGRAKPALRDGQQFGDRLFRVAVPRGRAVVLDPEDEHAAVGVGEGGHAFCHEVPRLPASEGAPRLPGLVPERLELEELALLPLEERA